MIQPISNTINFKGIYLPIVPKEFMHLEREDVPYVQYAEINQIFTDAQPVDESIKSYEEYFMTKERYCDFVESEDFNKALENSYVSDGEYIYYPISKYNRIWIEKQPFDYVVRGF